MLHHPNCQYNNAWSSAIHTCGSRRQQASWQRSQLLEHTISDSSLSRLCQCFIAFHAPTCEVRPRSTVPHALVHRVFMNRERPHRCWPRKWSRDQCIMVAQLHTGHSPLLAAYLYHTGLSTLQHSWRINRVPGATLPSSQPGSEGYLAQLLLPKWPEMSVELPGGSGRWPVPRPRMTDTEGWRLTGSGGRVVTGSPEDGSTIAGSRVRVPVAVRRRSQIYRHSLQQNAQSKQCTMLRINTSLLRSLLATSHLTPQRNYLCKSQDTSWPEVGWHMPTHAHVPTHAYPEGQSAGNEQWPEL